MEICFMLMPLDVVSNWEAFQNRATASYYRLGTVVVLALVFGAIAWSFVSKKSSIPTAIGSGWLTWKTYTALAGTRPLSLFRREPSVSELYTQYWVPTWEVLLFFVSVALGVLVVIFAAKNKDNEKAPLVVRLLTGFFACSGLLLIFRLLLNAVGV